MVKYIKHYYVDCANPATFLTNTNAGIDGKTHPKLDGLDVKFWFADSNGIDYCLSLVPESTEITSVSGLEEMTYSNWANDVETQFNAQKSIVANDSIQLDRLNMTIEEVMALVLDKNSVETMLTSFQTLNPLL